MNTIKLNVIGELTSSAEGGSGGGGGGNTPSGGESVAIIDFSSIGYGADDVKVVQDKAKADIAYSKTLYDAWAASNTNALSLYENNKTLIYAPDIDTSNVTNMGYMFNSCTSLTTIPQLDTSNVTDMVNMFYNCIDLKNLGGFKNLKVPLNLSSCVLLTHESLMNVINNLYDLTANGLNEKTLSIGSTNIAKLTADEIAIATNKGWTIK